VTNFPANLSTRANQSATKLQHQNVNNSCTKKL